ncbi:DUF3939 domain-containing protein [Salimicrobium halophilum]|uniref:DUF3939 domain-containing protein n=1 Tax=Salimicrobium halophilum TaxID=86666 RepID=A0A1G8TQY4_9BACI|nr:DUF3939 domain-containing protein [Salimicrobium halophilum]SDJ43813.1 Protein of unknown function [Salimicrobium halophilum]
MWGRKKKQAQVATKKLEVMDLTLKDVRKAINEYAEMKPDGVPLSVIIKPDLTIDYELLAPFIAGKPQKTYYMSRETYELFEEEDLQLAKDIDMMQQAVDTYMQQEGELPIIENDPYRRVNCYMLERLGLITHRPERTFYITKDEYMVDYKRD